MKEKEEINYLEFFDKIFGTKTDRHLRLNMPMLKIIFENFEEDLYTPNETYRQILKQKIKVLDKLKKSFTEQQKKIFNQYNEIENQLTEDIEQQLFMFGYIMASKLSEETKINV